MLLRALVAALLLATPAAAADLTAVNDWLYVLQPVAGATLDDMAATSFDLVVTDYSRDGTEDGEFDPVEIAALKASGKVVLAYLSIGEAEDVRFYWDESWSDDPPSWLGPSNPDFPDNYKVRYWDADWQAILLGSDGAYLDRILAQGFDGVYLDIIDAYYFWSEVLPERTREEARRDMIDLVEAIAGYARDGGRGEARLRRDGTDDFLVVPQNGVDVVLDGDDEIDGRGRSFLRTIDAVAVEDVFYDELTPADAEDSAYRTAILEDYRAAGAVVLSVDYVWNANAPFATANVARYNDYQAAAQGRGYVPYAAVRDRDLDEIVEVLSGSGFEEPQPRPQPDAAACVADGTTMCLNEGRFEVRVVWRDFADRTGPGRVVTAAPAADSGLFWFFAPDNWEMLLKVLDGCGTNGHFWVFAAATTSVEYTLTVTDTVSGAVRSYTNELGTSAAAITDATAFATCPAAPST